MPMKPLTLLYRGSLSGCNYACDYCPFAKKTDSRETLTKDKQQLSQFITWITQQERPISVFFTPWGEALIRGYYRQAIVELSQLSHVRKVVIQTNFSCSSQWLEEANKSKIAFWISYHPKEINHSQFIQRCHQLDQQKISYSVGMVGVKENFPMITQCRADLAPKQYLWINAYKRKEGYYSSEDIQFLTHIDPYFPINNQSYNSIGEACHTGDNVISVDGHGDITRCHFITKKLGNIYQDDLETILRPRLCTQLRCRCYIGYSHMPKLDLQNIYGNGLLERIIKHDLTS